MSQQPNHSSTSAATDVSEFILDLDGGQFERMLSIATGTHQVLALVGLVRRMAPHPTAKRAKRPSAPAPCT